MQPTWVYTLEPAGKALTSREVYSQALARAVAKASPHAYNRMAQGLAALEAYRKDVADPAKSFEGRGEWFCWAAFERLAARKCCAVWLRRAAEALGGDARAPLLAAAGHYERAFAFYERYRSGAHAGEQTGLSLQQLARTPERIAALVPLLDQGIAAERAGIAEMRKALDASVR